MEGQDKEIIRSLLYNLIDNIPYLHDRNTWPELTLSGIRTTKSLSSLDSSDVGDLSSLTDTSDTELDLIESADDSEEEFKQYLRKTKSRRQKNYVKEHCWNLDPKRTRIEREKNGVEDEYSLLPDISKLSIKCPQTLRVSKLGPVDSIVGCVALVKPLFALSQILDLDTILFNKDKQPVGAVCDIVGSVRQPTYCVKLDSSPTENVAVGTEIFYVPSDGTFTKKLIDVTLEKAWDGGDQSEEEQVFSDDEKEMQHLAKMRINQAVQHVKHQHNFTERKRNSNNRVHFQQDQKNNAHFQGPSNPRPPSSGASQPNGRGRGRRRRGQTHSTTFPDRSRQVNTSQHPRNTSYHQEVQPRREPLSTRENPYAEFGCYDSYTSNEVRKTVYRRM